MGPEQRYCRAPLARMFNGMPKTKWIPNANTSFSRRDIQTGRYESGRPDGFVFSNGNVVCVECKAAFGSIFLGAPDDPTRTEGWHCSQRSWYEHVAVPTKTPYLIGLWAYPEFQPEAVRHKNAYVFLVPPPAWRELESQGARAPITQTVKGARKAEIAVLDAFRPYALVHDGSGWAIPHSHPFSKVFSHYD